MPWIQLKINTTDKQAESISDWLSDNGALSVTFQDTYDVPIFEPQLGETPLWGNTDVIGLFEANIDTDCLISSFISTPFFNETITYKFEQLEDKDWEREWMDNFHPIKFGERLWICPSWRDIPDPNAVNVMLDPGLAFGTGTHPTTALCLSWLDSLDLVGKTVIDYGCGSGILAIAALKLGAKTAIGIDIDPQALQASLDNAKRNGVDDKLALYQPNELTADITADIVVANILAGPLKELAPQISARVKANGLLGLSCILASQSKTVCEAYVDDIA
ncbi:MAG: 50S ribosomal protein L11 methyltransferase, partial [Candidatus Schmidhempelia sp.]|nr:50S ribosomal protein L11 methyltransferase [Candidatus Schmidhempelia sp.]